MSNPLANIETARLCLQVAPPSGAARLLDFFKSNEDHLAPWSPPRPKHFLTLPYWEEQLELECQEFLDGVSLKLKILDRFDPNGPMLGHCNFSQFVRGPFQACYLGYALDGRLVGRGLMGEALEGAIPYVFESLKLHRIMANYLPINERSGRLLKRLGFVVEGYARDYLYINGAWRDHILTALTNPRAQRSTF